MTGMLASVSNLDEARIALRSGADIVDLKDPGAGALGALPHRSVRSIVQALSGEAVLSATTGDLPADPTQVSQAAKAMAACAVDFVKVGLFPGARQHDCIQALSPIAKDGAAIVIVLFADHAPDLDAIEIIAGSGCRGVMLDTAGKSAGGLRQQVSDELLQNFVYRARRQGLLVGLAGSLGAADIAPLLSLAPDYLGFRGALCLGRRTGELDAQACARIRSLIPATAAAPAAV